jgi:hypothetical protein
MVTGSGIIWPRVDTAGPGRKLRRPGNRWKDIKEPKVGTGLIWLSSRVVSRGMCVC